jgi:glycosyltransferase A (GT-A) superfamily protein (DUF2064 family)
MATRVVPPAWSVHDQVGNSFGSRLDHALSELAARGYARVVIVGRDCPQLRSDDIRRSIRLLDFRRLVIGPDHRGGCWLIALHLADRSMLREIPWCRDVDRDALLDRFGLDQSILLEIRLDLDGIADVLALARRDRLWRWLLRALTPDYSSVDCRPLLAQDANRRLVRRWQLPPPLGIAA